MARRLRIIHVIHSLMVGGSEKFALTLAAHLDPRRFESLLCAVDAGGACEAEAERLGIRWVVMHRRPGIDGGLPMRLYRLFRGSSVDVVHTHHFTQLFYGALAAKLAGARLIHTEHDVSQFHDRRFRIAFRILALFCDKVLAVGAEVERFLRERVGIRREKLRVIRAGIPPLSEDEARAEVRAALGLPADSRVVATIARLAPEKNHALLIDAFARVAQGNEAAYLLIAGAGPCAPALRKQIRDLGLEDRARLLGLRHDVGRLLAAADVFALSSDREGLPLAVLEAMAAGKPVVATAVGDLPRIIGDQCGIIVSQRDCAAFAQGLETLCNDGARARILGLNAQRLVASEFSLRAMIEKHESLYTAL